MSATTQSSDFVPAAANPPIGRGRIRVTVAMLGPAFVASVAYVDPGNFATNAIACIAVIIALNALILFQQFAA